MTDRYRNFEQLAEAEREGQDYSVKCCDRGSDLLLLGCHAGGIEPGTSEIVKAVAGLDLSYYLFAGIKPYDNGDLHITSTNFNEPRALMLLEASSRTIAFHGERSDEEKIYLGGLDEPLLQEIRYRLNENGFETARNSNPMLQGTSPKNICNRCRSGAGLQLELSRGLRKQFFHSLRLSGSLHPTEKFYRFVQAIRTGILRFENGVFC